jgi:hypothetical protein
VNDSKTANRRDGLDIAVLWSPLARDWLLWKCRTRAMCQSPWLPPINFRGTVTLCYTDEHRLTARPDLPSS